MYYFLTSDMRKGTCYQVLDAGGCAQPRPQKVKKNQCCCSKGAGWSYGPVCEVCPEEGSSMCIINWYLLNKPL